jgi:hypothetical protein
MTDYAACNKAFRQQKSRLTRAINSKDPQKVLAEVHRTVNEWQRAPFNGMWPDDWARWQRALDDALGWRSTMHLRYVSTLRLDDFR